MGFIWLQAFLLGLSAKERKVWRSCGDSLCRDSVLKNLGYWKADTAHAGPRFRLYAIEWGGDTIFRQKSLQRLWRKWYREPVTPLLLHEIPHAIQYVLLKEGYLYATVKWAGFRCDEEGRCEGSIYVLAGRRVQLDTIIVRGRWPAPRSAFYRITRLRPKTPVDVEKIRELPRRLRGSPYAVVVDTPQLWLFEGLAWLELTVKPKNSNRIDGALSLLPGGGSGNARPQLVGNLDVRLVSPLRLGEKIEARFAQLPANSQRFVVSLGFPYLIRGLLETGGNYTLWRQDTSFLTREGSVELRYRFSDFVSLRIGLQTLVSRLLSVSPYKEVVWPPPRVLDFRRRGFSLGWEYENFDIRTAPMRGVFISLIGTQGQRGYIRNPGLTRLAYERLPLLSLFQELSARVEKYTPLASLIVLRTAGRAYQYWSKGFFENELPWVGGEQNLRGFLENTFPVSAYFQGIVEGRLRTEEEGFLGAFGEITRLALFARGWKWAYAAGMNLQTRLSAGLLRITFALGRLEGIPWDIRRTVVSLSWVSEF
ncbi:MAG: hypothetical protein RMJ66_05410 [Bacteroidia bacterium]|nr:hypothetical protein [Bacteroidia bacterium]MDW8134486.1 hypothetical protein [Bacteroidia bacterium]